MLYLKQKSPTGINALLINKREEKYKVKLTTETNMQTGEEVEKRSIFAALSFGSLCRFWLDGAVRGNVPPLWLEEVSRNHQPEDLQGYGGGDQEEKEAAVPLMGHQR